MKRSGMNGKREKVHTLKLRARENGRLKKAKPYSSFARAGRRWQVNWNDGKRIRPSRARSEVHGTEEYERGEW